GLIGGHFLAALVTRTLRGWDFDASLRVPGAAAAADPARGLTPTRIAGILARLTVWAAGGWWLGPKYGRAHIAATPALVVYPTWALAAVLTAALALGGLLSSRLIEALHALPRPEQASPLRNGAATPHRSAAGAIGAAVYAVVSLLVLLIAADLFDWPL